MPTYEYACTSCGRHFDVQQSFSDAPLEVCEVCAGKLKRVFHPVGIVLKGSGFYATDNRGKKPTAPATKKDESSTESSAAKSEATPAEKKDKPKKNGGSKDSAAAS